MPGIIGRSQVFGLFKVRNSWHNMARRSLCTPESEVLFDDIQKKGIITLNRPKALNAINASMVKQMYPKLKSWESNKKFVLIKGTGQKAFSAGGDVVSVVNASKSGGSLTKTFFFDEYLLNCLISTYHIPYIALINGIVMGGGAGVSIHGSHRVATENAVFAMPETGIGFFPDIGGSYFLPRLGGSIGTFLGLTGYRLKGMDIMNAGLATHFCDAELIANLEEALINLKSNYHEDINEILVKFGELSKTNKDQTFSLAPHLSTINKCFDAPTMEHLLKNLEKDGSEFCMKQVQKINKMSPTSLKVTLEALNRGRHLSIQECLSMEYRISQRILKGNDFAEGIRAVLIDKDNSPKWNPSKLSDVSQEDVDQHFAPLPEEDELVF